MPIMSSISVQAPASSAAMSSPKARRLISSAAPIRSLESISLARPASRSVAAERSPGEHWLIVEGARGHNLKNLTVRFLLSACSRSSPVSPAPAKAHFINDILYRALARDLYGSREEPAEHDRVFGAKVIDKVIQIDQSPIGRTPRSNPATYTGVFTAIRDLFAMLPEARERGYKAGRFSFNVPGGRCETCQGDGQRRIEMNFMPDVYVTCEICNGKRYNQETLAVKFNGYSIADVLDLAIEDALPVLADIPNVRQKLQTLVDVGLGYIHLGQSATTLSGGEAQRMKLARELSKRQTGRTLYLLDEPTTGLHFDDVRRLLEVLHRLTDLGNTVIIIEHNLDVVRNADWLIDLGPEGGEDGGRIVAEGTPEYVSTIANSHTGEFLRRYYAPSPGLAAVAAILPKFDLSSNGNHHAPKAGARPRRAKAQTGTGLVMDQLNESLTRPELRSLRSLTLFREYPTCQLPIQVSQSGPLHRPDQSANPGIESNLRKYRLC